MTMYLPARIITTFLVLNLAVFLPDVWAAAADQGISPITPGSTASLVKAIAKVIGALALVVGLMVITMKIIRKLGMGKGDLTSGSLISILDTKMIAPKKYVAVLKIGDELVAVGITDQQINLLSHITNCEGTLPTQVEDKVSGGFSFPDILDKAKDSIKGLKNQH